MTDAPSAPAAPADRGPALTITALGASLVRGPDGRALTTLGAKSVALLTYLALSPGQAASRDVIVDLLWGRSAPDQGRASLRQELRRMRKAMGPLFDRVIDTPSGQVALRPGASRIDAQALVEAAESRETATLAGILELYGGAFLGPLAVNEIAFEDWAAAQNSRLEETAIEALLRLMLLDEAAGRLDRAASAGRALLAIDQLQEDVHAAVIRIHVAAGRLGAARQQLERCRRIFREELGEDPDPSLEELIPDGRAAREEAARPPETGGRRTRLRPARAPGDMAPLLALRVRAVDGAPEMSGVAAQIAAAMAGQLAASLWLRITRIGPKAAAPPEAAFVAELEVAAAAEDAPPQGALTFTDGDRVVLDGAPVAPAPGEVAPAVALARAAAGMAAAEAAEAAAARPPTDPKTTPVWHSVLTAWRALGDGAPDRLAAARDALEAAADSDPDDAAIQALLSLTYAREAREGWTPHAREALFQGREVARRALARAPRLAWGHHALGAATCLQDDPDGARAAQLAALRLAPGFAPAMGEIARGCAMAGDAAEALAWAGRALAIAPRDPFAPDWLLARAAALFAAGRAEEGAAAATEACAARPCWPPALILRAACLRAAGRGAEADAALRPEGVRGDVCDPSALDLAQPFRDPALRAALAAERERAAVVAA